MMTWGLPHVDDCDYSLQSHCMEVPNRVLSFQRLYIALIPSDESITGLLSFRGAVVNTLVSVSF